MSALSPVLDRLDQSLDQSLGRLFDLLKIKSISTDPDYAAECRKGAEWLVADLKTIGFDASVRDTPGHPMVVAHHDGPAGSPHVLFYGHYDVQPVDPLELWDSDPFAPAIKQAEAWMTEFKVPVMIEIILERVTNIAMGIEIDNVVEFEELAASKADVPTAVSMLD